MVILLDQISFVKTFIFYVVCLLIENQDNLYFPILIHRAELVVAFLRMESANETALSDIVFHYFLCILTFLY